MDYIDENAIVTPLYSETYGADKRRERRYERNERIRSRVWELDFIRGFCVFLMIFDHLMFDLGYIFGDIWTAWDAAYEPLVSAAQLYWNWPVRLVVQEIVFVCFFSICGISCEFSRSNWKRGLILAGISVLLTIVTSAVHEPIYFGVLHMLSVSILIVATIKTLTKDNKKATSCVAGALAVILLVTELILRNVDVTPNDALAFLSESFASTEYFSMDYFPLMPHTAIVLIGVAISPLLYPTKRTLLSSLDGQFRWYRPVNFLGRHAIECYLLHQVVWALLLGLFTICAFPNGWEIIVANFF